MDFYIDTFQQKAVAGPSSSVIVQIPPFYQGDTWTFRIRALSQAANFPVGNPPYNLIPNGSKTIQLAIGDPVTATHLTEQYTWNLSGDPADPYFYADIAFNTPNIATALSGKTSVQSTLEIKLVDGTPKTILRSTVTIYASVINNAALTVPNGLTPASMEAVLALLSNLTTKSITILSADETHSRRLWEDNDGTPHDDQS